MKKKIIISTSGFLVFCLFFSICLMLIFSEKKRDEAQEKINVITVLDDVNNHLRVELHSRTMLIQGLAAYIKINNGITHEEFQYYAKNLMNEDSLIRNIGLIKGTTMVNVYPLESNESIIGVNLAENQHQKDALIYAINNNQVIITGPVNLTQGGTGLISRTPIYIEDDYGTKKYWGMVSIVLDVDNLFKSIGLDGRYDDVKFSVGANINDKFIIIKGQEAVFNNNPIKIVVDDIYEKWELVAIPSRGWGYLSKYTNFNIAVVFLLAVIAGIIMAVFMNARYKLKFLAFNDEMTGLNNRTYYNNIIYKILKDIDFNNEKIIFLSIDINKFKYINDFYGHHMGDNILREVGKRIKTNLRKSDYGLRFGGDEFLIIIKEGKSKKVENIIKSWREIIEKSIQIDNDTDNICFEIKVSIGYSIYPDDSIKEEELLKKADKKMYEEKKKL